MLAMSWFLGQSKVSTQSSDRQRAIVGKTFCAMESASYQAFLLLKRMQTEFGVLDKSTLGGLGEKYSALMASAVSNQTCRSIIESGRLLGLPIVSAIDQIAIHGGYWKLISEGLLNESATRHLTSLFGPIFPCLDYYIDNNCLAPWVTLGAQECLLDMDLEEFIVIEYGSGMSTFFFKFTCGRIISYEDDQDPASLSSWLEKMDYLCQNKGIKLDLRRPIPGKDDNPEWLMEHIGITSNQKVIIFIDGCDRVRLFNSWAEYALHNPDKMILLLLDNSEIPAFSQSFKKLRDSGCFISNHYGQVYGQLTTKQCTSMLTFHPLLLVGENRCSPSKHDRKWGALSFQDV